MGKTLETSSLLLVANRKTKPRDSSDDSFNEGREELG